MKTETLWHITVLSNFAKAFDKYSRRYCKSSIGQSTFPDQFFLLRADELDAGTLKAGRLLKKLGLDGDHLIALKTSVHPGGLEENVRTGIGRFVPRSWITLEGVAWIDKSGALQPTSVEDVMANSLRVLSPELAAFDDLTPRTFSVLPIARGCQASCPFCFSEASASAEQDQARLDLEHVSALAQQAKERGAERFVITGGGEPGLLRHELMQELIAIGSKTLGKVVLITNGHHLARHNSEARQLALSDYANAGLEVLAVSRHHHDDAESARIMSLETDVSAIAQTWSNGRDHWSDMRLRLICVLQKGGIDSLEEIENYVDWAASIGVSEICFKELYVSTSIESYYHRNSANQWSHEHQVPLSLVLEFAAANELAEIAQLPWGAPIFQGERNGRPVQIAAYTEPSLLWERSHRVSRSWNLMADGTCLVSLEDRNSLIEQLTPA